MDDIIDIQPLNYIFPKENLNNKKELNKCKNCKGLYHFCIILMNNDFKKCFVHYDNMIKCNN
tara:strand:+ start:922 stop:1107 length:186 start_codon:yes stop_codon:yes gene_type:complete